MIHSSFGSWGQHWNACGAPFKEFLHELDFEYLFGKLMGSEFKVFDGAGSFREILGRVASHRREGYLDKAQARELWTALQDAREEAESSSDQFVESMEYIAAQVRGRSAKLMQESWEYIATQPDPQAQGFWRELWPTFKEALAQELHQESSKPVERQRA
jgi:hypothetical protein